MSENLLKREDFRQLEIELKKKNRESNKIDSEDSDYILKQINDMKLTIESKLENFDENQEKCEIDKFLTEIKSKYESLNKYVNDSALYLPKYNLKSSQNTVNSIRIQIDSKINSLVPKSKFSFKSSFKANQKPVETKTKSNDEMDSSKASEQMTTSLIGFNNLVNCEKQMSRQQSNGKDIHLDGLENCRIEIMGAPNALKVNNLSNCEVFSGPTTTSIFISNCKKCVFKMAAQQIRIHTTIDTDFYIHVTSRAIIEDTRNVRFGRYDWTYDKIKEDFEFAKLDINTNNWKQIDDFDCLSTDKQSNNWSLIE